MTPNRPPTVFIAVPVFQGAAVVAETLASIAAQTWPHWRAVIAIDGGDEGSAACCAPFLAADARFSLEQRRWRRGWAGNLNGLMDRCDGDYFVYWQQDDVCDANYLETLVAHAEAHPEALCSYADVQWFGARHERHHLPSIVGSPFERVRQQVEGLSYVPFRGLIRGGGLRLLPRLRTDTGEAAFEDLVWSVHLARSGELHAVPGTCYFKRAHADNTHGRWMRWPVERLRAAWMACALGAIEAAWPAVPVEHRESSVLAFVERFVVPAPGRGLAFDASPGGPGGLVRLGADILREARTRLALPPPASEAEPLAARSWFAAALLDLEADETALARALLTGQPVRLGAGSTAIRLLGAGWSLPEAWGTWTTAHVARIELPALDTAGAVRVVLEGQPFLGGLSPGDRRRLEVTCGARRLEVEYGPDAPFRPLMVDMDASTARSGGVIELMLPGAVSPASLGQGDDPRLLGFALTTVTVSPASA